MSEIKSFRSSRLKGTGAAALFAVFAFGGTAFLSTRPLLGWALVLVCGGVALFALANLLAGGTTLRVGRKGYATVANIYNVPLQELCDTMNDRRDRYLAAAPVGHTRQASVAGDAQPGSAEVSATEPARPGRPFLLAFCAAFLVLVLNIVLRLVLKLAGTPVTLGIASAAGGLALIWFLKHLKRPPTPRERSLFLWTFSALIITAFVGVFLPGAARHGFNPAALFIFALHALAYPAAAQFFVSEKRFQGMLPRVARVAR
jgi:hypothetical protein